MQIKQTLSLEIIKKDLLFILLRNRCQFWPLGNVGRSTICSKVLVNWVYSRHHSDKQYTLNKPLIVEDNTIQKSEIKKQHKAKYWMHRLKDLKCLEVATKTWRYCSNESKHNQKCKGINLEQNVLCFLGNVYKFQTGSRFSAIIWHKHLAEACRSTRPQVHFKRK